ncbi:hypothetical protein FIU85_08735 [Roseovarius sp. THAF8]|uniref:hypothetical protein n=1 Tax=Roseovarius sp. THAF8 TaxID=2587846 RepID=UPI001267FAB8|nr:hypothetical protein [Roseovarius sp. THAF8]QFT97385.1 hypothetical protein FIU85_08735 [Roseovarius sp. THAF8]
MEAVSPAALTVSFRPLVFALSTNACAVRQICEKSGMPNELPPHTRDLAKGLPSEALTRLFGELAALDAQVGERTFSETVVTWVRRWIPKVGFTV